MKRWIWERKEYPDFTYDIKKLEKLIQKVSFEQGYLIALTETMDRDKIAQRQSDALITEALTTSAIEEKNLDKEKLKASIEKNLNLKINSKTDIESDSIIEVLIDANINYEHRLTIERIFGWHRGLFPSECDYSANINVGQYRSDEVVEVASGPLKEKTYYSPPPRELLELEMKRYLKWFNKTEPDLIKAAIAHLWFVIIHPLEDGNGRVARVITDLVFAQIENTKTQKLYSMSSSIFDDKIGYYEALEYTTGHVQREKDYLDITVWCEWFLSTFYDALVDTKKKLQN